MSRIERLANHARELCESQGHMMMPFVYSGMVWRLCASGCRMCGAWVWICDTPMLNEIEITGSAITAVCGEWKGDA